MREVAINIAYELNVNHSLLFCRYLKIINVNSLFLE